MDMEPPYQGAVLPDSWFVVFHPKSAMGRWIRFFTPGKYKHVSAFAYVPGCNVWVFYDAQWDGLRLVHMSQTKAEQTFVELCDKDCAVIKIKAKDGPISVWDRAGFSCVSATKHLLGLSCVSITPTGLYHGLIRNGGVLVSGPQPQAADRSVPPS